MNWDPWQREVLDALGHQVYRTVAAETPALPDDALLHALLRAAARDPADADAATLARAWSPTAQLRGNAIAKRALWPQLRALRASSRPS